LFDDGERWSGSSSWRRAVSSNSAAQRHQRLTDKDVLLLLWAAAVATAAAAAVGLCDTPLVRSLGPAATSKQESGEAGLGSSHLGFICLQHLQQLLHGMGLSHGSSSSSRGVQAPAAETAAIEALGVTAAVPGQ
jgi:hypothetical protein